jgi:hypothetical protein
MVQPVFVTHVMKTGGSTVTHMLLRHFVPTARYPPPGDTQFRKTTIEPILALDATARAKIELYSVHMPACIADQVAPDHLHLTVLREPVARTVSHLRQIARSVGTTDLTSLYDDPRWRHPLLDFQTRVFAITAEQVVEQEARRVQLLATIQEQMQDAATGEGDAGTPLLDLDAMGDLVSEMLLTAVQDPSPLDHEALDRALVTLRSFDLVGVTEDMGSFCTQLARELGIELGPPPQLNVSNDRLQASDDLLERIRADNERDLALYQAALGFSGH